MNELAISGIALAVIAAGALAVGFATGEMPFNYKALDTGRATAPITFWGFAASWALFIVLGTAIALRHWSA